MDAQPVLLDTIPALEAVVGREVALSRWFTIDQARISAFADVTDDHQWIHLDAERAMRESPYGGTVAHGFLTIALLPAMLASAVSLGTARLTVNYGCNKVRFPAAVPAGSRIRGRFTLQAVEPLADCTQLVWLVTMENEAGGKPVCVAEFVMRRY
ncbi:MaoC family dehydratase [Massilia sp. YMA4]|uniref:MaoC family dehydratase n=1 Tax=[Empedobacter] haloabium TaxID=592317 RepID=A0ABZ1USN1_9BURK|nr:MaoC family dehydratase [Massilia sp. YMA4]AXA91072.1 MaoC family dehydratase [Massilia sp. YMA4]